MYNKKFLWIMFNFGLGELLLATMATATALERESGAAGAGPDTFAYTRVADLVPASANAIEDLDNTRIKCCCCWFRPVGALFGGLADLAQMFSMKKEEVSNTRDGLMSRKELMHGPDTTQLTPDMKEKLKLTGPFADLGGQRVREQYLRLSEPMQAEVVLIYHPRLIDGIRTRLRAYELPFPSGPTYELAPGREWSASTQWFRWYTERLREKYAPYLTKGDVSKKIEYAQLVGEMNFSVTAVMNDSLEIVTARQRS